MSEVPELCVVRSCSVPKQGDVQWNYCSLCVLICGHRAPPSLHLAAVCIPITSPARAALGPLSQNVSLTPACCFSCQLPPPPLCLIWQIRSTDWNNVKVAKYTVKCLLSESSGCVCCDLNTPFYIAISEISPGLKALLSLFFKTLT